MMFARAYSFYDDNIYPFLKDLRGSTWFGRKLKELAYNRCLRETRNGFIFEFGDIEILLRERSSFDELLFDANILKGYTKKRSINETDTVLDAGAYPGEFTVYVAKKAEKVIALEPDPSNAEKLRENIELNGLENVEIIEKGLWNKETSIGFNEKGEPDSSISPEKEGKIETTTIDKISSEQELDFIKMDIEGAEIEALEGAKNTIEEQKPFFSIASYHKREGSRTRNEVESILREGGYKVETGFESHLTTWGEKK